VTTPNHCVVAQLSDREMKAVRLKELLPLFENVINSSVPFIETPPLESVRQSLPLEFPYAHDVIDTLLGDLVGEATIRLRPTLFFFATWRRQVTFLPPPFRDFAHLLLAHGLIAIGWSGLCRYRPPLELCRTLPSISRDRARGSCQSSCTP
jgi:hypothetical protein